jgi:formylglycine-generating enzyme required for sulfatase activity
VADINIRRLAYDAWRPKPLDIVPRDTRFDDGALVTTSVGSFNANAWGLHDMHGNAAEWTRSSYRPYPFREEHDRGDPSGKSRMVVRGGSWYDRPKRCRSGFRLSYHPHQKVYNVGFRVICQATPTVAKTQTPTLASRVDP